MISILATVGAVMVVFWIMVACLGLYLIALSYLIERQQRIEGRRMFFAERAFERARAYRKSTILPFDRYRRVQAGRGRS